MMMMVVKIAYEVIIISVNPILWQSEHLYMTGVWAPQSNDSPALFVFNPLEMGMRTFGEVSKSENFEFANFMFLSLTTFFW